MGALPNNPDQFAPKIAYSEQDPHWGWTIGTGSYLMDFNSSANHILFILLITLVIALIIGLIVVLILAKNLVNPLKKLSAHTQEIAQGNLSMPEIHIKNKDEVGDLAQDINTMTKHLKSIIGQVMETSQQAASTAEELSASSEEASKVTDQITTSIQEISYGAENKQLSPRKLIY